MKKDKIKIHIHIIHIAFIIKNSLNNFKLKIKLIN